MHNPFSLLAGFFAKTRYFRGKQRLYFWAFRFLPFAASKSNYGPILAKNIYDATYRASLLGSYGDFIPNAIDAVNSRFVFLDIGANQGIFGIFAAQKDNCVQAICIEPNPSTFGLLNKNTKLNAISHKIISLCGAVSNSEKRLLKLGVFANHSGRASLVDPDFDQYVMVPVIDEALLKETIFNAEAELFIKLDVEGVEHQVMEALQAWGILQRAKYIVIEINYVSDETNAKKSLEFLTHAGWQERDRVHGYDDHYDALFVNMNLHELNE